jgi:transcription elongation factor GreA
MILTKEGLEKLKKELEELLGKRKEISVRIQTAKELGDLSENAEYSEAKDSQRLNETRISEVQDQIRSAEIVDNLQIKGVVQIGSTIKVSNGEGEKTFVLVGANEADPIKGMISNVSPLGEAFLGHKKGDSVEAQLPSKKVSYKILDIS